MLRSRLDDLEADWRGLDRKEIVELKSREFHEKIVALGLVDGPLFIQEPEYRQRVEMIAFEGW